MGDSLETCKNCEQEFDKAYKFCPHCGQQAKEELTVGVLFYNTISNYFSFDARFFKSFLPLMLKPGYLARKFIEGKRLLYLHPAQLYLFISVVFFFLMSMLVVRKNVRDIDKAFKKASVKPYISDSIRKETKRAIDSFKIDSLLKPLNNNLVKGLDKKEVETLDSIIKASAMNGSSPTLDFGYNSKQVDSLIENNAKEDEIYKAMGMGDDAGYFTRKLYAQTLKFQKNRNGGQIFQAAYDSVPIALFVLLPIFALILKLFNRKKGTYAHHLVFSFYFFAFLFTVSSITLIVNFFVDIPGWLDFLIVLSTFFYLFIAIKRFYDMNWIIAFIKTGIITFIYMSFVIPIAFVILVAVGFLFY